MSWQDWMKNGFRVVPDQDPLPSERPGLDMHAQPAPGFNLARRRKRNMTEAMGLIRGILADDIVVPSEVHALAAWLGRNGEEDVWPVNVLAERVSAILEDGIATEQECEDLAAFLREFTGEGGRERYMENHSSTLPLTKPAPDLFFEDRCYVFTGKFVWGTRRQCEQAVVDLGGRCARNISKQVDVLVIGDLGSRDWIQTSYGRKIEAAMGQVSEGVPISIVHEEHWARFV